MFRPVVRLLAIFIAMAPGGSVADTPQALVCPPRPHRRTAILV